MIQPGSDAWIGVLGGGQLGRMLALAARPMGYKILTWTGGDRSGAADVADEVMHQPFDDRQALEKFCSQVEVATAEFENLPGDMLKQVEQHVPLRPNSHSIITSQHREREKIFLSQNGFGCARHFIITNLDELQSGVKEISRDCILKTAEFGYDGKGQQKISGDATTEDLANIWQSFDSQRAVLEERVELDTEISVLVARGITGDVITYDPAENIHRNHILDVSIVPARLPDNILEEARKVAIGVADALDYIGILAVEFFISMAGRLLVNEIAPRPHNSGHHTIDGCMTSQFQQQTRAICGLPLGCTNLKRPTAMLNLLGDLWPDSDTPPDWSPIFETPGASLHLYGKAGARAGRKMGHVNFLADDAQTLLTQVSRCREALGMPAI
jgi:5-(carboxyamino)imidazole ribonucleotide synthase